MKNRGRVLGFVIILASILLFVLHFSVDQGNSNEDNSKSRKTMKILTETWEAYAEAAKNKNLTDEEKKLLMYSPFQPFEEAEFPVSENKQPRIQHILHQIFCTEYVPEPYKGFIQSFTKNNPKWEYRLWNHVSGRKFLQDRYPELVKAFDKFEECDKRKSNILKYAVVHAFGGMFAEFYIENLRPLDKATLKYSCIVPVIPFENTAMGFQAQLNIFNFDVMKNQFVAPRFTSDLFLCRKGHSFLKLCIHHLTNMPQAVDSESYGGTSFMTHMFMKHNNISDKDMSKRIKNPTSNAPYFYKGDRPEDADDAVYVPNSQYFYDNVDPYYLNTKTKDLNRCWKFERMEFLSSVGKRACMEFECRKTLRKNRKYTFTFHHNHNSKVYNLKAWMEDAPKINIKDIVPGCISYI